VHALDLLLLAQLQTEVAGARARGAAVLAGLAVELGFVRNRAARALQIEVGAFAAGQLGLGSEITCHLCSFDCLSDEARRSSGASVRASLAGCSWNSLR